MTRDSAITFSCPLCQEPALQLFFTQRERIPWHLYAPGSETPAGLRFFRCGVCDLITKDPAIRATPEGERLHYAKHNNDLTNPGYREHLMKLIQPLRHNLQPNAVGLDFGCGPTLSIEKLFLEDGIRCSSFDPFFFADTSLLTPQTYDFITCSEVVEHFHAPHLEFTKLASMLNPHGLLAIMTQTVPEGFKEWWYHRDPTHVVFYSPQTFLWIAERWALKVIHQEEHIVLLRG